MVGTEADFLKLLGELARLDYDVIAAYESAISRIDNPQFKNQLQQFREDHQRHTVELSSIILQLGGAPPSGSGAKSILTQGKVVLGSLMGDKAILVAMKTNEDDTNTAYERAVNHKGRLASAEEVLRRGLADERRHRAWMEEALAIAPSPHSGYSANDESDKVHYRDFSDETGSWRFFNIGQGDCGPKFVAFAPARDGDANDLVIGWSANVTHQLLVELTCAILHALSHSPIQWALTLTTFGRHRVVKELTIYSAFMTTLTDFLTHVPDLSKSAASALRVDANILNNHRERPLNVSIWGCLGLESSVALQMPYGNISLMTTASAMQQVQALLVDAVARSIIGDATASALRHAVFSAAHLSYTRRQSHNGER